MFIGTQSTTLFQIFCELITDSYKVIFKSIIGLDDQETLGVLLFTKSCMQQPKKERLLWCYLTEA